MNHTHAHTQGIFINSVDCEPCGKCGCCFVSVTAPRHWPVGTVALTCFACGSVVDYIDGLLLLNVKQVLRERVNMTVTGGDTAQKRDAPGYGLLRELILMGIENKLSAQDIAEALEVSEEYVELVSAQYR
jgi:hypothetical protein